jgi:hypothetical protein
MKRAFLGLVTTLLAGAATALAQPAPPAPAKPEPARPDGPPGQSAPAATAPAHPADVPAAPQFPCCPTACPPERYWFEADYLLWFIKDAPLPHPLVTTGPPASGGIIFNPGVKVLAGGSGLDYETFSGGRFTLGRWLGDGPFGVEGSGFFLKDGLAKIFVNSHPSGAPLLARPIVNAANGNETSVLLSSPGQFAGGLDVNATSVFWGAELNFLGNVLRQGQTGIDVLVGFRYLELDENLDLVSFSEVLPGGVAAFGGNPVLAPNALSIRDSFATTNQFYGGQLGVRGTVQRGNLRVDLGGKVAFGVVHQQVRVDGFTTQVAPGGTIVGTLPGGVLALPTNSGRRARDDDSIVPEGTIRIGYQLTPRLNVNVGYTVIYWDNVARPGDQIDRRVNLLQVPSSFAFGPLTGPKQPVPLLNDSRFWAQGVNFGLAFRF